MVSLRYEINNTDPREKKRFIRAMFTSIVPSYDRLNRILSLGIDRLWRRSAMRLLGDMKGKRALDLCCGTGDLSRILHRQGVRAVSLDFCGEMVRRGIDAGNIRGAAVIADASVLPFADVSFDILTIAFGIRNIPDIDNFIDEARRVLESGGVLMILELTRPKNPVIGFLYSLYLEKILPLVGWLVSGERTAYRYLSRTIATFIDPRELAERFAKKGFTCRKFSKTFGIATILICEKTI